MMVMDGARSSYVFYSEDGIIGSTMAKVETKINPPTLLYHFFTNVIIWLQTNNTHAAIPQPNKNIWNLKDQNQCLKVVSDILLPRIMRKMMDVEVDLNIC